MPPLLILFVHGGGFVSHTCTEVPFAAEVLPRLAARGVPARCLALQYSVGESASRDLQLRQLMHAYRRVAAHAHRETRIVLCGDSAGGHLAVAMMHALLAPGSAAEYPHCRAPDALVAISPWAEVATAADPQAYRTPSKVRTERRGTDILGLSLVHSMAIAAGHQQDYLLPPRDVNSVNAAMPLDPREDAEKAALEAHLATAFAAPFAQGQSAPVAAYLPPTIIFIGGGELFSEEGRRLSAALSRLSEDPESVTLVEEPDAPHDWPFMPFFEPVVGSSGRAMDRLVSFIMDACGVAAAQCQQVHYGL